MTTDVPVVSRPHSHGGEAVATATKPAETKAQALRSYAVADFPAVTGREEEWRFTPLKRLRGLPDGSFAAGGTPPAAHFDAPPAGVTIRRVADEPRKGSVLTPFDRVSALAYERSTDTLVVDVAREAVVAEPVTVRLVGTGAEGASFGHTFIEIGALAEVTLIVDQTGSTTYADNVEVVVGDGAKLTLIWVGDWADDAVQAQHQRLRLGRDSHAVHVAVNLGGDLIRQYISVEYAGPGGDLEAYGVYFATALSSGADGGAKRGQHLEHRQFIEHQVNDCRSRVTYRGALQGADTHTVWVGDVLIGADATGTDSYEVNRNLVLTDGARADSVPNLEIETGEIINASHASATGRFEDEHLFYLMSRGIDELSARRLVVRGFFVELLERIPAGELRERLETEIDERLAGAGA